jgi:hypothetical protein
MRGVERLADRIERARSDVAVDDPDCGQREREQGAAPDVCTRAPCAVTRRGCEVSALDD